MAEQKRLYEVHESVVNGLTRAAGFHRNNPELMGILNFLKSAWDTHYSAVIVLGIGAHALNFKDPSEIGDFLREIKTGYEERGVNIKNQTFGAFDNLMEM